MENEASSVQTNTSSNVEVAPKEYSTSYLPSKSELYSPRPMLAELKHWHIEVVHILIFFLILIGLFVGAWKRPNLRR